MKHKSQSKENLYETYHQPSGRSLACRYFFAIFIAICLGVLCGLLGFFIGQNNFQEEPVINDDGIAIPEPTPGDYFVGVGRYDVTGPITEVNMMGYAVPSQIAHGLHLRLYSRAFVFADLQKKNRVVFASVDSGMGSQIVKLEVVKKLKAKYGDLYNERNVVLSGTHSHSGPAGFFQFLLFEVTSLGFIKQSTDAFVDGIVRSIEMAHDNMKEGFIHMMSGDVHEGNINRSPSSYLFNPQAERDKYQYNTEQEMTLLRITDSSNVDLGLVSWYPVHGTSMNNTNELISSDNKGRASTLYERMMETSGKPDYVAAFAQANVGDVSPNTKGAICINSGRACDFQHSTCGIPPRVANCIASGPGKDMFESTDIIGQKQFDAAKYIIQNTSSTLLKGTVSFAHQYVDMTQEVVTLANGSKATTCKPAMGYSFAAGTTDGPGALNFVQSMTEGTPFWNLIRDLIARIVCSTVPTQADYDCHLPKPVLLPTGFMDRPYAWHPSIVDVQLLRVGQLFIAAVPGEFSTMAGRRLKDQIKQKAIDSGMPANTKVVIAGLSNVYTHYITTLEEFGAQRYEGGSTIFGPHTHAAYVNRFAAMTENLIKGDAVDPGPAPENIIADQIEILPKPRPDRVPQGKEFGDVMMDARELYGPGDAAIVKFYGANPRHDMKLGSTYLEVQRLDAVNNVWETLYTDASWETKLKWEKMTNVNSTKEKSNVIIGLINLIAEITGYRIDLAHARGLFDDGKFTANDLEVELTGERKIVDRESMISNLKRKGIIIDNDQSLSEYPTTDESHITVEWDIPMDQPNGLHRIVYHGDHLSEEGTVSSFIGMSREFQLIKT